MGGLDFIIGLALGLSGGLAIGTRVALARLGRSDYRQRMQQIRRR